MREWNVEPASGIAVKLTLVFIFISMSYDVKI